MSRPGPDYEADKMLDEYIYDYLMKRNFHDSARTFLAEGNVSTDPVVIEAPQGFLLEWWCVFWELYIAKTGHMPSEAVASYLMAQQIKAREMLLQQELQNPNQNQQMQMQMQMQRPAQWQQCMGGTQLVGGSASCPISDETLRRLNQRDALDDATIKQKEIDKVGQLQDSNHASLLAVAAKTGGQTTAIGQTFLCTPSILPGNVQARNQNQQLPGPIQDIRSNMRAMMRSQAVVPEGSLVRVHGSNEGGSNLTLNGCPLRGFDQVHSGHLQQNNLMQSASLNKFSRQQQLMLQTQRNLVSPSVSEIERRRLQQLNNQVMGPGIDGQSNIVSDSTPNIGTSAQAGSPILPHPESDMSLKQQVQESSQEFQQYSQHPFSSQKSRRLQQQEKIGSESMRVDGNNQASKRQIERKRKLASSSGPANSSGTAKRTGSCTSSPSTPSAQTPGDVMTEPAVQQNVPSSKSLPIIDTDGLGSLASPQADMHHIADAVDRRQSVDQEFSFKEIKQVTASSHEVECCDFSSDGKLFVTGGRDKKASLWCTESFNLKSTFEEHTEWITDTRFCPSMLRFATSSADKTVRVWDADNPGYSLRTFTGHASTVVSLDFHPSQNDLICSCDNTEIRYWSIKNGSCAGVFKGGATQMRFQPCMGSLLAATKDNFISIFDVETMGCRLNFQGHDDLVRCVCWHPSGEYLASLSDDLVRIWTVAPGSNGECIHELTLPGKKFNTCAFHPLYNVLIMGCHESLELWDFSENRTMTLPSAHNNLVSSLAVSNVTGLVASVSHDKHFKFWK